MLSTRVSGSCSPRRRRPPAWRRPCPCRCSAGTGPPAVVNLYASRSGAFRGRHEQLADVFGAWAAGAVTNADLTFSTRLEAVKAPAKLLALDDIDKAVGVVAATQGVTTGEARTRLENAGALAGIAMENVARAVLQDLRA